MVLCIAIGFGSTVRGFRRRRHHPHHRKIKRIDIVLDGEPLRHSQNKEKV
jgi:hypothetical protein